MSWRPHFFPGRLLVFGHNSLNKLMFLPKVDNVFPSQVPCEMLAHFFILRNGFSMWSRVLGKLGEPRVLQPLKGPPPRGPLNRLPYCSDSSFSVPSLPPMTEGPGMREGDQGQHLQLVRPGFESGLCHFLAGCLCNWLPFPDFLSLICKMRITAIAETVVLIKWNIYQVSNSVADA